MKKFVYYFLLLLFGLVTLGQLQRFELPLSRALYLHEIVMVGFCLVFSWRLRINRHSRWAFVWMLINIWILISILFGFSLNHQSPITPILYLFRLDAYILFGLNIYQLVRTKVIEVKSIEWLAAISITVIALLGWLQFILIPDTRSLMFLGWDDHYLRIISTLFDPGFTGALLVIGSLLLQRKLFSKHETNGITFAMTQWMWLLTTSALLFTYSRASFLAFAVGSVYLFLKDRQKAYLVILAFFSLAVICLPRPASEGTRLERTASVVARISSVKTGVGSLTPIQYLIGKGWYNQKVTTPHLLVNSVVTSHDSAPDNSTIFVFTSLGLIGIALFAWFGFETLRTIGWNDNYLVIVLALGTHSLFTNTLFYPFVLFYLAVLVALPQD